MTKIRDYFSGQADHLDTLYKGSLVPGSTGNTGDNREDIVREWLENHIPRRVTAEFGGKIIDATGYLSDQVDLVIYDNSMPHFGTFPRSYFFSEGVNVAIQVKSILTSKELKLAIENLVSVKKCQRNLGAGVFMGDPNKEIMTGVFAFDTDYSSSEAIVKALKSLEKRGLLPVDFVYINKKAYIAYNPGIWVSMNDKGETIGKLPPRLPSY